MREHVRVRHVDCQLDSCPTCDGGLFCCAICGGAERTLTTECPGEPVPQGIQDAVREGRLDFRGGWFIV